MEATPSLACANKCVFCWRHHTNPVGKSWQWKMDDPLEIVNTAIDLHTNMIKQMKGVPGNCFVCLLYNPFVGNKTAYNRFIKLNRFWIL